MHDAGLGRRTPTDWSHYDKYPYSAIEPVTVTTVERITQLPYWHWSHDQGAEGACVGFGGSMTMAIINLIQRRDNEPEPIRPYAVRYDPWWLWDRSKEIDEWADTNPGDSNGTSCNASFKVLKSLGHVQVPNKYTGRAVDPTPLITNGISAYRWLVTVDEMRQSIANGIPMSIGVNWYSNFDTPVKKNSTTWFIGEGNLGHIRGGHCVCVYGASDKRQAFRIKNSWGREYPLVWMPYTTMQRLIDEQGEVAVVTDH